jgi:integrase
MGSTSHKMGKFETNQIDLNNDGKIILYQRPDVKNPKWQCRISVSGSTGYKIFSTKEVEQSKAERIALQKYEELYFKVKRGGSLKGIPFSKVFNEWKSSFLSIETPHKLLQVRQVETLGLGFFKSKPIDEISDKDVFEMMEYLKSLPVKSKSLTNSTDKLKPNSIRHYRTSMNHLFSYAKTMGYVVSIPNIPVPPTKANPRPHFTKQDWKILTEYMRKWVVSNTRGNRGVNGLDHKRHRERFYLQQFILILGNTGIRIGEMRNVRWVDLDKVEISVGDERLLFSVDGKTGKRSVIANTGVERYVKRIWEFRSKELGNDPDMNEPIFCHPNGKSVGSYKKGFITLLEGCDLRIANDGGNRTLYSLRHTYATMRINEVPVYQLAVNMGTSVQMIERFYSHARSTDPSFAVSMTKGNQSGLGTVLPFDYESDTYP